MRKKTLFYLFFILSISSFSSTAGFPIVDSLEEWLGFVAIIAKYGLGIVAIGSCLGAFLGARENATKLGLTAIVSGFIISNVDWLMDKLVTTAGVIF